MFYWKNKVVWECVMHSMSLHQRISRFDKWDCIEKCFIKATKEKHGWDQQKVQMTTKCVKNHPKSFENSVCRKVCLKIFFLRWGSWSHFVHSILTQFIYLQGLVGMHFVPCGDFAGSVTLQIRQIITPSIFAKFKFHLKFNCDCSLYITIHLYRFKAPTTHSQISHFHMSA